jgi:hypothetical protein
MTVVDRNYKRTYAAIVSVDYEPSEDDCDGRKTGRDGRRH